MNKFDKVIAGELANKIIEAEAELSRYLNECFPSGTRCGAMLMYSQKNPTPAEIISVSPDRYGGSVNIRIDTAKPRSRLRFRSISARDILIDE